MKYAFRCNNCGFLDAADHAAEAKHPHACRVCGWGVTFKHEELAERLSSGTLTPEAVAQVARELATLDPAATTIDSDNWEVLADCTTERLTELGLTAEQVERHEPWPAKTDAAARQARKIDVLAGEGVLGEDQAAGEEMTPKRSS